MTEPNIDALFEARAGVNANDGQVSRIKQLIAEDDDTGREIDQLGIMLEDNKLRRRELRNSLIPKAMLDAGMRAFTTDDGLVAKIAYATDGALGSARNAEELAEREAKIDIIIEHGGGEIVKQLVTLEFPKEMAGEAETMRAWLATEMEKRSWPVNVDRTRTIHHQTLGSWIKEKMNSGDVSDHLPPSFFERVGLWFGEVAKITKPKVKK